jgi:nicotinamide mononucleotide (NMN) deamidase PncC
MPKMTEDWQSSASGRPTSAACVSAMAKWLSRRLAAAWRISCNGVASADGAAEKAKMKCQAGSNASAWRQLA